MPVRRPSPVVVPRTSQYGHRHDYGIDDSIDRMGYISNSVLEDTYEAATKSRNRDHELLRNANAAIRPGGRTSRSPSVSVQSRPTGRTSHRHQSLPPPLDVRSVSPTGAVVPYRGNLDRMRRSNLSSAPSPNSLLSTRINSYLRGSSMPPAQRLDDDKVRSGISYKSFLAEPRRSPLLNDARSTISYRSYLSDPAVSSPFFTRGTSKFMHGYSPSKSALVPKSRYSYEDDDDDGGDDGVSYDPESYRRKYRIVRQPVARGHYTGGMYGAAGEESAEEVDDEDEYYDASDNFGTYSCPRPSGTSPHHLSTYDAPYDGSYEADMADMYDYVPFGPSRQGILELTTPESLPPLTSPSVTNLPSSSSAPSVSLVPSYSKNLDNSITKTSFANNLLFDSIVSSTAARAKAAMEDSNLPAYKNASLVLSVEGSAVSPDGQNRYGFRYYPPPIPLTGSTLGLDQRIMGVLPKPVSPADSFLGKYLDRLRDIRSDVREHVDKDEPTRRRCRSVLPSASAPSYVHRTIHMPVHLSGRQHSVPVSSYRSRLDDGRAHHVDVYPLVVSETRLPRDKALQLPFASGSDSPSKLTVLDKINIKAAIIGSRLESASDAGGAPRKVKRPRSQFAANKLRELKMQDLERRYK